MDLRKVAPWIGAAVPLAVFAGGYAWPVSKRQRVIGQPPSVVFGIVWTLIGASAVLHSIEASKTYEIKFLAFLLAALALTAVACTGWLYYDHMGRDDVAIPMLAVVMTSSVGALSCAAAAGSLAGCIYSTLPLGWAIYALSLNLVGANTSRPHSVCE